MLFMKKERRNLPLFLLEFFFLRDCNQTIFCFLALTLRAIVLMLATAPNA